MSLIDEKFTNPMPLGEKAEALEELLAKEQYSALFVLCDDNTEKYCFPDLEPSLNALGCIYHKIVIPHGESNKQLNSTQKIWTYLAEKEADRSALMINLGGGMICDLGAFSASLFKRGIDFIHIPTSLLAMVDATVGGKCAIDFSAFKNQIGLFKQPKGIFEHYPFLKTLPTAEISAGMAELIKHALIGNRTLWESILQNQLNTDELPTPEMIRNARQTKLEIVERDPYEKNERKKLNFGHTIGHAIESYFLKRDEEIPHGLAVAAGMWCEAELSEKQLGLMELDRERIQHFLKKQYRTLDWPVDAVEELVTFMKQDKKRKGSEYNFTLLPTIGKAKIDCDVDESMIVESLNRYREDED